MNVELVNPFVNSVVACLEKMTGIAPKRGNLSLKESSKTEDDITGVIGFAELGVTGSICLSFPTATILKIYSLITGETVSRITYEVQDLTGELTNMIAGGAKREYSEMGLTFTSSIATALRGLDHTIHHQVNTPVIVVPFTFEKHTFNLEVTLKIGRNPKKIT